MSGAALVLSGPGRLAAAQRLAGLAGRVLGRGGRLRRLPGPGWVGAWFGACDLPAPPPESFRAWWKRTRAHGRTGERAIPTGPTRPRRDHAARRRGPGRPAPAGLDPT
jgi:L-lactate dehydrogenase complex protein LldF